MDFDYETLLASVCYKLRIKSEKKDDSSMSQPNGHPLLQAASFGEVPSNVTSATNQ